MHYMIHACPQRMWYVEGFLIPSMKAQGISEEEITVWNDTEGKGNLFSSMTTHHIQLLDRIPGRLIICCLRQANKLVSFQEDTL